jgi:hypothetical protein
MAINRRFFVIFLAIITINRNLSPIILTVNHGMIAALIWLIEIITDFFVYWSIASDCFMNFYLKKSTVYITCHNKRNHKTRKMTRFSWSFTHITHGKIQSKSKNKVTNSRIHMCIQQMTKKCDYTKRITVEI